MPSTARQQLTLICFTLTLLAACSAPPEDPEQQVLNWLTTAEQAIEARDLTALKPLLADDYLDSYGNDRRRALNIMRLYLLRNQAPQLLIKTREVSLPQPDQAELQLTVAAANASAGALRGELLRFSFSLSHNGGRWQLRQADWENATLGDFF